MLTNNRIWKNRTVGIGVIGAEDALNYGFRLNRYFNYNPIDYKLFPSGFNKVIRSLYS